MLCAKKARAAAMNAVTVMSGDAFAVCTLCVLASIISASDGVRDDVVDDAAAEPLNVAAAFAAELAIVANGLSVVVVDDEDDVAVVAVVVVVVDDDDTLLSPSSSRVRFIGDAVGPLDVSALPPFANLDATLNRFALISFVDKTTIHISVLRR